MKRSPVLLLVVLALLLAGCFGGSGGFGNISVVSEPSGAKIFLDGQDTGKATPAVLERVRTGRHEITLERDGYKSETRSVSVERNKTTTVNATLLPVDEDPPVEEPVDPSLARVSGFVTASNGGQRLPGAAVTAYEHGTNFAVESTVTDEHGSYTLYIPAGEYDIVVDLDGHGQAKRQALIVDEADQVNVDFISKKLRDPSKGATAPTIHVYLESIDDDGDTVMVPFAPGTTVPQGAFVSGLVEVESDYDVYRIQVWIGQRGLEPDFQSGILNDSLSFFLWDFFDAPGETELIVAAYDWQENFTEVRIPFSYEVGEPSTFLHPVDLVLLAAVTYGHDLGLYRAGKADIYDQLGIFSDPDLLELPNGHTIDTSRLDKDVTMFVEIVWSDVTGAAGYEIQRSFGPNGPWETIAKVGWWLDGYVDTSPALEPGVPVYYRIRAIGPNDEKGGWSSPVWVTPLDRFAIYLESPADDATNVSLTPTFSWTYEDVGADEYIYDIFVAGVTGVPGGFDNYFTWYYEELVNEKHVRYNFDGSGLDLLPGKTYQWNVIEGVAVAYYRENSIAVSFPWTGPSDNNGYSGAANGEFVFTTALQN